ncbi:FAD-dependent oxidoreductase [Gemmobacter lanyuensis]
MKVEVLLPQWGMGMSEGTITSWLKKVGERIEEDEPLAEIEAEKATQELESPPLACWSRSSFPRGKRSRCARSSPISRPTPDPPLPPGGVPGAAVGLPPSRNRKPHIRDKTKAVMQQVQDTHTLTTQSPRGDGIVDSVYDLIVIGAGCNGAGIARDAAARGLRVALVEKEDIGSGTSSWSGRLIHGGLRYLEQGDIALVRNRCANANCCSAWRPISSGPCR